ncbi:MAG TPA: FprA family A-type flavoprotein [bacterium]|nr:FprA family A-type flavoprotein [bacterium]
MPAVEICPNVYWIGVNDRTTDLFEGIWPISHEGVSYNAYLIDDEKKAILDLAKAFKTDEFFEAIGEIADIGSLDYVVIHHLEPDHSGVLSTLIRIAPKITLLCSEKCKEMLASFYGITENVRAVKDGETISLGKHTLQFFMTPHVHWPETMMTYESENQILFSCDAFGGYGALRGTIFDDQCTDHSFYETEALRYYVNIVAKFSGPVLRAIEKLSGLDVRIIAPSHGLIWRKDPGRIVHLYKTWAGYAGNPGEPGITLMYASMYGNTEKMMNAVAQGISGTGAEIEIFDVARTHVSYILPSLWTKSGVVIGAPTYEGSLFPLMIDVLNMVAVKHIRKKRAAVFGSYGWSGGAQRGLEKRFESLQWELMDQFEFCGAPTAGDIRQGVEFGRKFGEIISGGSAREDA